MKNVTIRVWALACVLCLALYIMITKLTMLAVLVVYSKPIGPTAFADDLLPLVGAIVAVFAVFAGEVADVTSGEVIGRECHDVREGNSQEVVRTQYVLRLKNAKSGRTGERYVTEEVYNQYRIGDHYGATK